MITDIKLSTTQISKIIQSGESFGSWLINLGKEALTNVAFALGKDTLLGLVGNLSSDAINKFERKKVEKELSEEEKDLLYLLRMKIWMTLLRS